MRLIKSVSLMFSTYTRIPAPRVEWTGDEIRLAIAFLPLAGAVIGVVSWCWQLICDALSLNAVLYAAVAVALPVIITGGVHIDGYCDTCDALASWRSRERSLEIMKDPHIGAFALIRLIIHLLLCFAIFHELYPYSPGPSVVFMYPLSRCMAAFSAIAMPTARKDGMLAAFTKKIDRRAAIAILTLLTIISAAGWIWYSFPAGLAGLALCLPVAFLYRRIAMKRFGGATGDTTGYYLQIAELTLLAGLLLGVVAITRILQR